MIDDSDDFLAQILKVGSRVCYRKLYARAYVGRRTVSLEEVGQIVVMLRQAMILFMDCSREFQEKYKSILTALKFLQNLEKIDDQRQWIVQSKNGYDLDIRPTNTGVNPAIFYPVSPNPASSGVPGALVNPQTVKLINMLERVQHSMR
jgi:hypothetical protein